MVGEFERAFYGTQLTHLAAVLDRHGVQLWLAELDGPFEAHNPTHQALVMLLGAQSRREVLRSRFRVSAAMRTQTRDQGRYLGGRPPYGYRLVDAGPHPNTAHARWGRRLHRLEPDPATAPHVRSMFAQRLAGSSLAAIARTLNHEGVPCPSTMDPARNRHRTNTSWSLRTVAAILANPRYTGRQVWNRERTDHSPDRLHRRPARRRNPTQDWIISKTQTHPELVDERDFITIQSMRAPSERPSTAPAMIAAWWYGSARRSSHW